MQLRPRPRIRGTRDFALSHLAANTRISPAYSLLSTRVRTYVRAYVGQLNDQLHAFAITRASAFATASNDFNEPINYARPNTIYQSSLLSVVG